MSDNLFHEPAAFFQNEMVLFRNSKGEMEPYVPKLNRTTWVTLIDAKYYVNSGSEKKMAEKGVINYFKS